MTTLTPEAWRTSWLSRAPLATNDFASGVYRHSREVAEGMRYLEANSKALLSMLVIDVDHDDTLLRALERPLKAPEPSWVALSGTGSGHVGYILQTPVCRTDSARLAPMRLAARVESGLTTALGGDRGYAGVLTKNPLHHEHETYWARPTPYTLQELATGLGDLMPRTLPRKIEDNSGLGRNCALFNTTRTWAYEAVSRYWGESARLWEEVTFAQAWDANQRFAEPLPYNEVIHLARSVSRWTRRNITQEQTEENRRAYRSPEKQRYRSLIAAEKRTESTSQLRTLGSDPMPAENPVKRNTTARELAERFGVSERSVRRIFAQPRDEYLEEQRERGEQILSMRAEGKLWREIAEHFNISIGAAQKAGERAKKRAEESV